MAQNLNINFERCCRLCAEEQEVTLMIFSAEAEAMLLQNKLNNYLLIEVEENDKLPKNICIKCCSKLQTVCEFIDSARNAQEVLRNRSLLLDQINNDQNLEKVKIEPQTDQGTWSDDENKTGMEVSVDPMIVLQNSEETMSPVIDNTFSLTMEDVTHLHSVDQENVTIKLIKKGDLSGDSGDEKKEEKDTVSKPFPCLTCKRSFYTELALKNHLWVHFNDDKDEKRYKCNSCDERFDLKGDLITHLKQHRMEGLCQMCGRCFRSEKNLNIHMAAHLSKGKSYACKICGRSYNTRSNLKTHSITHSNERPYQCHLCKKSFKRNQDLKFHINQHTGAKPYKCPFCEKCFASSGNCYSHRNRMHPGKRIETKIRRRGPVSRENQPIQLRPIAPKPNITCVKGIYKYQCTMCDHSFVKRDNYTYHMYQHTGEKPFQCTFCPQEFVTRRGLLLHHDKEHPAKDRPLALLTKNVLLK